jgi:hypothetical protein
VPPSRGWRCGGRPHCALEAAHSRGEQRQGPQPRRAAAASDAPPRARPHPAQARADGLLRPSVTRKLNERIRVLEGEIDAMRTGSKVGQLERKIMVRTGGSAVKAGGGGARTPRRRPQPRPPAAAATATL